MAGSLVWLCGQSDIMLGFVFCGHVTGSHIYVGLCSHVAGSLICSYMLGL